MPLSDAAARTTFLVVETMLSVAIAIVLPIVLLVLLFNEEAERFRGSMSSGRFSAWCSSSVDLIVVQALFKDVLAASGVELLDAGRP